MSGPNSSPETQPVAATTAASADKPVIGAAASSGQSADTAIRPFKYRAPEEALVDLRRRVAATKWPQAEYVPDTSQGVQLATMQKLASYWVTQYDWRKVEARLDALPQFTTNIDGLDIYFIHVRSKEKNALPLIVTHGWPGSPLEQLKIIDPLTNPTAHGAAATDAFDIVIPAMPGYGFSGQPTAPGWDPPHIARAWTELMRRLGYDHWVAQGGDWGALVTDQMGVQAAPELLGIHVNMAATIPDEINNAAFVGAPAPAGFSAEEKQAYEQISFFYTKDLTYAQQMGSRPQTLYGIDDSPIGLAAWILDHDTRSYEMIARAFDGVSEGLSRDDVLDNITLYWLTNSGISSARLYWENKLPFMTPKGVKVPTAVSVFPDELCPAPRSWTEQAYPNLIHYNRLPKGGHFAAWEQPAFLVDEIRTGLRSLRK